jgi:hypothetical protein
VRSPRLSPCALLAALIAQAARACPLCDSETAEETRAGIFNDQFFPNLFAALLPFLIVIGIALAIHLDWGSILHRAPRAARPSRAPAPENPR